MRKDARSEQTGKSRKPHAKNDIQEQSRESGCAKWIQLRDPPRNTNRSSLAAVAVRRACATTPVNGYGAGVPARDEALIQQSYNSFKLLVPASRVASLANILNAGWIAYNDTGLWHDNEEVKKDRNHVLYDIVLKSIEVLEFEADHSGHHWTNSMIISRMRYREKA